MFKHKTITDKMFFFTTILFLFSLFFMNRKRVFLKFALVLKENQILKRSSGKNRISLSTTDNDRIFIHYLLRLDNRLRKYLTIVTPETVLYKWKDIIKNRYTSKDKRKPGRSPLSVKIKKLIIDIKNSNYSFGIRRISGELKKLNISVSHETVRKVIQNGRRAEYVNIDDVCSLK